MKNIFHWINSVHAFRVLLIINFIISGLIFCFNLELIPGDYATYSSLADGLLHGVYSMYYFLSEYFPDTFRNPGYPMFLAFFKLFTSSFLLIQIIHLIFYYATVYLIFKILNFHFKNSIAIKNIFLVLLCTAIYIVIYTTYIVPEILTSFLMVLALWFDLKLSNKKFSKFLILGLLYGFIFQVRPVFLFFPVFKFVFDWMMLRRNFAVFKNAIMLLIYFITMLPYGLWNYNNHGAFSITSLRGGAEVLNAGYWAQKIPDYTEDRSFYNTFFEEPILFIKWNEREENIKKYNREWDYIDSCSAKYLQKKDSTQFYLKRINKYPFPETFSSKYTIEREKIIKKVTIQDMMNDKRYVLKSKIYSAVRLWVTGVPLEKFKKSTLSWKIILLVPFLLTGTIFLMSIVFIPIAFLKYKFLFNKFYATLLLILYYGLIHVPFVIQSRYTIPVRMLLLMILAISIYHLFLQPKSSETENQKS